MLVVVGCEVVVDGTVVVLTGWELVVVDTDVVGTVVVAGAEVVVLVMVTG